MGFLPWVLGADPIVVAVDRMTNGAWFVAGVGVYRLYTAHT